jgi:hypothetical protein
MYLGMLDAWLWPSLEKDFPGWLLFQQDRSPQLHQVVPGWTATWKVDRVKGLSILATTVPRCDNPGPFWGYFKDYGYTTPIPQSVKELWGRISDVATWVDAHLLWHNLEDFQCCLDTWLVTHGANIKYMWQKLEVCLCYVPSCSQI